MNRFSLLDLAVVDFEYISNTESARKFRCQLAQDGGHARRTIFAAKLCGQLPQAVARRTAFWINNPSHSDCSPCNCLRVSFVGQLESRVENPVQYLGKRIGEFGDAFRWGCIKVVGFVVKLDWQMAMRVLIRQVVKISGWCYSKSRGRFPRRMTSASISAGSGGATGRSAYSGITHEGRFSSFMVQFVNVPLAPERGAVEEATSPGDVWEIPLKSFAGLH